MNEGRIAMRKESATPTEEVSTSTVAGVAGDGLSVAGKIRSCLESASFAELTDIYAPQALLDVNLPRWRFQRRGHEAIISQYEEWYPEPVRISSWVERPTEWGGVIESAVWQGEGDGEEYYRQIELLFVDDGRIAEHIMYCTGKWDSATVTRHKDEAPMIRW